MPQFAYAFDPHAANDDNIVRNEEHVLRLDMTPYRVIIPNFAPFYEDLEIEVKCNGKLLLMGVDFYLSHKYFTGVERTGKLMYGGIWIINPKLSGTVTVKYRTLGGKFTVARSVLDDYLANRQVDPSTSSWEEIINDDPNFPAVDIQFDRKSFVDEGDVQTAVREIADVVRNKDQSETDSYRLFEDWLNQLKDVVDNSPLTTHQDRTDNPHGDVWYEAEALHKSGISKDAAKVFNKTISELTDYVNSRGITQADLDAYVKKQGGNTIVGDVVLKDGLMSLNFTRNGSDYVAINISNGNVGFIGIANGIVHADRDKNTPGATATVRAGNVDLTVTSSGAEQDDDDLTINGKVVIHDGNLDKHLPTVGGDTIEVVTKDSATLNFSGRGLPSDPLRADVVLPTASDVVEGVAVGTVDYTKDEPTKLAFSEATHALDAKIQQKVPNTVTINGLRLDRNITLTSEHFGLGNVSNLADINMPVNQNHRDALANKSLVGHTHTFEEMNIIRATGTDYGITFIANDPSSSARDRAFSVSKMKEMQGEVEKLEELALQRLPDDVMDVTQYGGNSYLPIPVQGEYGAAGRSSNDYSGGLLLEEDGTLVLLRNGASSTKNEVYYFTANVASDGSVLETTSTSTPYAPDFLPEGHSVKRVVRNTDSAMLAIAVDAIGSEYLTFIVTNRTFDSKRHVGCRVSSDININSRDLMRHYAFVENGTCYIIGMRRNVGGSYLSFAVYSAPLSSVQSNVAVSFTKHVLTGTDLYGDVDSGTDFRIVGINSSRDLSAKPLVHINYSEATGANAIHADFCTTTLVQVGNVVKYGFGARILSNSPMGNMSSDWCMSLTIDLGNMTVTPDATSVAPAVINPNRSITGPMVRDMFETLSPLSDWDSECALHHTRGKYFAMSTRPANSTVIAGVVNEGSGDLLTMSEIANRDMSVRGARRQVIGNFGSVSEAFMYGVSFDVNKNIYFRQRVGLSAIRCKYDYNSTYRSNYDHEFGPTSDRVAIGGDLLRDTRTAVTSISSTGNGYIGAIVGYGSWSALHDPNDPTSKVEIPSSVGAVLFNEMVSVNNLQHDLTTPVISVFVSRDSVIPSVAVAYAFESHDDGTPSHNVTRIVMEVTPDKSIGTISSVTLGRLIDARIVHSTGLSASNLDLNNNGSSVTIDGNYATLLFNGVQNINYIGWSAKFGFQVRYNKSNKTWDDFTVRTYDTNRVIEGWVGVPDVGIVSLTSDDSDTEIIGSVVSTISSKYQNGDKILLHSSKVVSGWWLYFTQEVQYFINSTQFMMPVTSIDLSAEYPTTHRNNTFYIYASVEGGVPHYVLKDQYEADSSTAIYIGFCKTDTSQITELSVNRATRLGDFREFNEHLTDPTPHGLDLSRVTTDEIGLGLLENKDVRNTLVVPTFKEVFDSWYRLSHSGTKPYPALPEETETWVYDEATDSIRNTTNSSSFIGMVSPEDVVVGDYDFITGLSSTNADDDWIGVIFAMVVIDGIEHTLSALCSGTDTRDVHFAVYYNWGQGATRGQKTLFSHTTTLKHGWDEIPERILTVNRRGDVFNLHITKMMTDAASEQTFSFDVKDHPELSIFRSAVRFGYCSQSQPRSTWRNILRPDEDGKNFYASQKLYRDNFSWSNRMKTISGVVAQTVNGGDVDTFDVPIPAEFRDLPYQAWVSYDYSSDSGGGINNAAITSERIGDVIRFTTRSHTDGGFYESKLRYNITFFNDVRMI